MQMRFRIFISYSHKDKAWLEELEAMLSPLARKQQLVLWSDKLIQSGDLWSYEIENALQTSQAAVLLVSKYFLASDFISKNELPPLLTAAKEEGVKILWLPVGDCLWRMTPIKDYNALWEPSEPLNLLGEGQRDQRLREAAERIAGATWTLKLTLNRPQKTTDQREVPITGKIEWKSREAVQNGDAETALRDQGIVIVPLVNSHGFGWYMQNWANVKADGSFESIIHCGTQEPSSSDQPYSVCVCAITQKFAKSLVNPLLAPPRNVILSESHRITRTK
jgi:TIR domain